MTTGSILNPFTGQLQLITTTLSLTTEVTGTLQAANFNLSVLSKNTVYVDTVNYTTVQAAINAAELLAAASTLPGVVVQIPAGQFEEDVVIKKNVSLNGAGASCTRISNVSIRPTSALVAPGAICISNLSVNDNVDTGILTCTNETAPASGIFNLDMLSESYPPGLTVVNVVCSQIILENISNANLYNCATTFGGLIITNIDTAEVVGGLYTDIVVTGNDAATSAPTWATAVYVDGSSSYTSTQIIKAGGVQNPSLSMFNSEMSAITIGANCTFSASGGTYTTISGTPSSFASNSPFTVNTSGDWAVVPNKVDTALDRLATAGIVKSQAINLVLASPGTGSAGVPTFRSLVIADLPGSIPYSKLSLTGTIVNADISASAAIAYSKLASLTSAHILVGSAGNVATDVAVTGDISLTNAGVTAYSGTVPLNKGGTGQTTKAPAFDALQPMTTGGDLIYGGASGTGTRLANGSAGQVLLSGGGTTAPAWFTPGQYTDSVQTSLGGTNFPTSGQYGDATSITLGAGTYDLTSIIYWTPVNGIVSGILMGISTTSGNSATGLLPATNFVQDQSQSTSESTMTLPNYRVTPSGSTTYYLKFRATYNLTAPTCAYRLSAVKAL